MSTFRIIDTAKMFSKVVVQLILLPALNESSSCFISLPTPSIFFSFPFLNLPGEYVMAFYCGLNCIFLTNDVEYLFICLLAI